MAHLRRRDAVIHATRRGLEPTAELHYGQRAVSGMSKRYRKNPHTAGRVINGLAYIVTPDTNRLHTLNATATHLWRMAHSGVTVEEGAGGLAAEFDVTADSALGEVEACLRDLEERLILVGS